MIQGSFFESASTGGFPSPREFQEIAHRELRSGFMSGHRLQILMAPTGAGKTVCGLRIINEALARGKRAIFICDRKTLINQCSAAADSYGMPTHGIMQAQNPRWAPHRAFQIASAQTIQARGMSDEWDVVVCDEAHTRIRFVENFILNSRAAVIGLSATPFTKGLGKVYSRVVNAATMSELTRQGILTPLRVLSCARPDMTGAEIKNGEWTPAAAEERGMGIIGDVVDEWTKNAENRKTIIFGPTIAHCQELVRQFTAIDIGAATFTADTTDAERKALLDEYRKHDSKIRVLVSVEALAKGFDCILEGTMVLTDRGEVPIEKVLISDKVWDGVEFVSHRGPIFKGVRNVITYAGITATADHLVFTGSGWAPLGDVAANGGRIARTGRGAKTVRLSSGSYEVGKVKMRESESQGMVGLWREGHKIHVPFASGGGALGAGESGRPGATHGDRPDQQRRQLRARQSPMVESFAQQFTHQGPEAESGISSDPIDASGDPVFGQDASQSSWYGSYDAGDHREIPLPLGQAQGRVWDILDAGPRNRFTAAGLLVHNCADVGCVVDCRPLRKSLSTFIQMIGRGLRCFPGKSECLLLDHSGNVVRFADDFANIYFNGLVSLDDGEKLDKEVRTDEEHEPKSCHACGYTPCGKKCVRCGFESVRKSLVEISSGEAREFDLLKSGVDVTKYAANRIELFNMIASFEAAKAETRGSGNPRGSTAHKYKAITGQWPPSGFVFDAAPYTIPSAALVRKIRSLQIAFIKSRKS